MMEREVFERRHLEEDVLLHRRHDDSKDAIAKSDASNEAERVAPEITHLSPTS